MKTRTMMAKNLHAGMYLVEKSRGSSVGRHICELYIDRKRVDVKVNEGNTMTWRHFKRTTPVRVTR